MEGSAIACTNCTLKEKESVIGTAEVTCSGALLSAFASSNQHFGILCMLMHSKHAQLSGLKDLELACNIFKLYK